MSFKHIKRKSHLFVLALSVFFLIVSNSASLAQARTRKIIEYPLPTPGAGATNITLGPDGNLWFTEMNANQIGRITPTGTISEFPIPSPDSSPGAITSGPDGNVWFTEFDAGQIGKITPSGTITEYPIPTLSSAEGITSAGHQLWFTETTGSKIARTTIDGPITEYPIPSGRCFPQGITRGPKGTIWFAETQSNKIGTRKSR